MADENKDDETPKPQPDLKQAHPHQKDKGTVVHTAFGEPMSGGVADIADGDDE